VVVVARISTKVASLWLKILVVNSLAKGEELEEEVLLIGSVVGWGVIKGT